jgi:hypothetical protein
MQFEFISKEYSILLNPDLFLAGMNNREVIDQVERGYRMAQPSHITYPESKTMAKEVASAQSNVYKVRTNFRSIILVLLLLCLCPFDEIRPYLVRLGTSLF